MAKKQTIKESLEEVNYLASDQAVAKLAREYVDGIGRTNTVRGSYLKILVAHSQKLVKNRASIDDRLAVIEMTHEHLYAVVLNAVTTPDIAVVDGLSNEEKTERATMRNRRSTFARTAKSVLTSWVRAGGKLEKLVAADVRKDELQRMYQPKQNKAKSITERVGRVERKLESLVKRMIDEDPDQAEHIIEEMQQRLSALLHKTDHTPLVAGRQKVGEITLNPH